MKTRRRKPDNNSEEVSVGHSTVLYIWICPKPSRKWKKKLQDY
jgi:hypothetical protein